MSVDDDHAVFVLEHVQGPTPVALRGLLRFADPIDAAPAADDALNVFGGARPTHRKQPLFGLRRRDPR